MGSPQRAALLGAASYEFRMQIRRRSLWITMALFSLLIFTGMRTPWTDNLDDASIREVIANWAISVQMFMPIAFGLMLADRTPRDPRFHMNELFSTYSARLEPRWIGKYLGSALATMTPIVILFGAGVLYALVRWQDPMVLIWGAAAFLAINLPGLLFVAAFSLACPTIIWAPLYQVLFVGYWFWGNILPPDLGIPTLSNTVLTPIGGNISMALFDVEGLLYQSDVSVAAGLLSLALLLGGAAAALAAGLFVQKQKRAAG